MIETLLARIEQKQAVVGVIGLGYVGLPLVLEFARSGFFVLGFDTDDQKIQRLQAGQSYIEHIPGELLAALQRDGRFEATGEFARLGECDAILICVPTPLTPQREPDLRYIKQTLACIRQRLRTGQLICLESTSYPGTTDELAAPLLTQNANFVIGRDLFLAYSPEREDPGNAAFTTRTIPKVVGGLTKSCTRAAQALYAQVVDRVVTVTSPREAEMTKLLENTFRAVNIALVNELKLVADRMDIDFAQVIQAAATKPFGFMSFQPGPGIGGACLPTDPFYLTWKAREYGLRTRFVELAGEINQAMPDYVVQKLAWALNERGKAMKGARVLVSGVAYKKDVDDLRESPALEVMERLLENKALVYYHDPHIPVLPPTRKHRLNMRSVPLDAPLLQSLDAVLITTDHSDVDYALIARHAPLIIDTRNAMNAAGIQHQKIIPA